MPGPVTIAGLLAFDAQIRTPAVGAWTVDLRVDADAPPSGRVTIVAGNRTLSGTVTSSVEFVGVAQVRVVAGAAGLGGTATPRPYSGPTAGAVIRDILRDAGEALAASSDAGVLAFGLDAWETLAEPAGAALGRVLAAVGARSVANVRWRALDDGTIWVGTDAWPDAGISTDDYEVQARSAERNYIEISCEGPLALAGKTFEGGRVNFVQDDIPHEDPIRSCIWFEPPAVAQADRLVAAMDRLARGAPTSVDHRFRYWADVIAQAGGTVDARPEIAGVPDMGGVPLAAQAGDSVDGVQGGRVLLGWAGDGSQRVAHGFDAGAVPTKRTIAVLAQLLLGGIEASAFPALVGSLHQLSEAALVTQLIAAFSTLAAACTGPLAPLAAGFAAVGAALTAYQAAAAAANNFLSKKVSVAP